MKITSGIASFLNTSIDFKLLAVVIFFPFH